MLDFVPVLHEGRVSTVSGAMAVIEMNSLEKGLVKAR